MNKPIITIVEVAAVGALAYFGYKQYQKYKANQARPNIGEIYDRAILAGVQEYQKLAGFESAQV